MSQFGVALKGDMVQKVDVTRMTPYRAPEARMGVYTLSMGSDMWALGCVWARYSTVGYKPLFACASEMMSVAQIFKVEYLF